MWGRRRDDTKVIIAVSLWEMLEGGGSILHQTSTAASASSGRAEVTLVAGELMYKLLVLLLTGNTSSLPAGKYFLTVDITVQRRS